MKLTNEQLKILVNDDSFFISYMSYDMFGKLHEEAPTVEEFFNLKKEKFLHLLNN